MKKYLLAITLFATLVLWSGCTQEETNQDEYAFTGTIVDAASGNPLPNVPVMVTNGTHIYTSTKTDANGIFRLYINIYEINNQHYIWIGDETMEQKRVEIRGFSSYETNLGTFKLQCQGAPVVEMGNCNVGKETVVCTASITSDGYLEIDEKGFCFGKNPKPSVYDEKVVCGSGKDDFMAEIPLSKFDKSSNYYVRPYAKNSKGTGYGKEMSFTTTEGLPTVESLDAKIVNASSATIGGRLIENGSSKVYERGVCWDTDGTPDINDNYKYISGDETGEYWIDVNGLKPNTKYFARAYARNNNGPSYGRIVEFMTIEDRPTVESLYAKNVEARTASLGGRLVSNGGYKVYERGICWDTDGTPNIDGNHKYISGDETGEYWIDVNNLNPSTKYYARAYAKNENGVSYGRIIEFTTVAGLPTVESLYAKNVTAQSVSLGGELISNGGYKVYERGVCWDTDGTPNIDDNHKYISSDETGEYWIDVNGLKTNTKYFARAYAKNENGVSYGRIIEFTTVAGLPTVESSYAKNVEARTASLGGRLVSNGGYKVYERGICWDTDGTPNIDGNHKYISGDETGEYWIDVNNLNPSTKYYARAYAKNENGVSYGNLYEFITKGSKVIVSIGNVTNITSSSATLAASIGDAGSPAYTECGFCYSSSSNEPTIYDNKVKSSFRGVGQFTCSINGLDYNKTYYVRAYAIQNGEAIYSSPTNFRPTYSKASVTLNDVTNIEETTATFKANVTNAGDPNITEKGFCWSSSSSTPTIDMERKVVSGTYKGSYNLNISNLNKGTTYYVRAYVIQDEEVIYSNTLNFTTIKKPIVTTEDITNLRPEDPTFTVYYSVTFNGTISDAGVPAYIERGFVYSFTFETPDVVNGTRVPVSGTGTGKFSKEVNNLFGSEFYYVRAYVKTENGYIYGDTVSFSTY